MSSLLLAGCGAAPEQIQSSGIDELVIPLDRPRADDFVDEIDNPFLPLTPGNAWVYTSSAPPTGAGVELLATVMVSDETAVIEGIDTTLVRESVGSRNGDRVGRVFAKVERWFAQDRRGNVWLFGETITPYDGGFVIARSWRAGVNGARAGLAMAAVPRVGDGYLRSAAPGVVEERVRVLGLEGTAAVPFGDYTDLVELELDSQSEPADSRVVRYARGVGPVQTAYADGRSLGLVSFTTS